MSRRKVRRVLSVATLVAVLVCAQIAAVDHSLDDTHPANGVCALCVVNLGSANVSAAVELVLDVQRFADFEYSTIPLPSRRVESHFARGPPQAS